MALFLLAWFAQLCLPVAHAMTMAAQRAETVGWCGDPTRAAAIAATLPTEIRAALQQEGASPHHLASCAELCATGFTPAPISVASTVVLRAPGIEPTPFARPAPRRPEPALTPPSQGPPAQA